jgi:hypothetical protein
LEFL